jgi:hypothetical protein
MSGQLNPIDNPQAWDVIIVAGVRSPGVCELSGFKRDYEWDIKKGKGAFGATTTFVGRTPAKGSVKIHLWLPSHFVEWDKFRALLKYDPTKTKVSAVDIYHPALADVDIKSVVVESIGSIEHEKGQLYSVTIGLLEYFPPPKASAVSTPQSSKSGAGAPAKKDQDPWNMDPKLADAIKKQEELNKKLFEEAQKP